MVINHQHIREGNIGNLIIFLTRKFNLLVFQEILNDENICK